ncbi:VanZ family protein [Paenibacillus fonticola]|uniref:VanZ family protein n=1 Tax=Paenibacillus fonticola TaxID=379896 RepID=UPI003B84AFBE
MSGFTRIRRKYVTSVVCLAIIVGIEALQFITMLGYFDVDDIILNFVGCLIGTSMYDLVRYIKIRVQL